MTSPDLLCHIAQVQKVIALVLSDILKYTKKERGTLLWMVKPLPIAENSENLLV
jgi:hypothetical protein